MTRWQPCTRCRKALYISTRYNRDTCADCRNGSTPRRILRAFARSMIHGAKIKAARSCA